MHFATFGAQRRPCQELAQATCAFAVDDVMYVMGGIEAPDGIRSGLKFDSRTHAWSEVAHLPEAITYAGACVVGSDLGVRDQMVQCLPPPTATARA
jgi:hypothetical protein